MSIANIKLYNSAEAAKLIGVTAHSIKTYANDGRLQGQKIGGHWKFTEEAIERFIRGEQRKPEAAEALAAFVPGLATKLRDLRGELVTGKTNPEAVEALDQILLSFIGPMELLVKKG